VGLTILPSGASSEGAYVRRAYDWVLGSMGLMCGAYIQGLMFGELMPGGFMSTGLCPGLFL